MNPAHGVAAFCVALACAAQSPEPAPNPPPAPTTGEQILARAKEVFRAHARPPYVVYTLVRRDKHNGEPDFENSYTLKIWCRTDDRSALTRRVWKGKAYGSLQNVTVAFDEAVDPGPPTADIFERALFGGATPGPEASALPPVIGGVSIAVEYDYRVVAMDESDTEYHLRLEPRRDPQRNRIDDLWVDRESFEVRRTRVRDHLYVDTGSVLDDEYDVHFAMLDGVPIIDHIHGITRGGSFETDYRFREIAFPATLPAWYFDPKTYGEHAADAPS